MTRTTQIMRRRLRRQKNKGSTPKRLAKILAVLFALFVVVVVAVFGVGIAGIEEQR